MRVTKMKTYEPGTVFYRLTVISTANPRITKQGRKQSMSLCRCECGNQIITRNAELERGGSKSCGCLTVEKSKQRLLKHGFSRSLTGKSIRAAHSRCNNKKHVAYKNYGGRGITIDPEWVKNPQLLIDEIGPRPCVEYTLDRIDNDGNYEKGNVRWATKRQQAQNKRRKVRDPGRVAPGNGAGTE
jgi:hypothetical protein